MSTNHLLNRTPASILPMTAYRMQRNNRGFTLIELLVVIAIISIIAAILFPVFAQAREKARQITCASNERQLGLAIIQYVQDSDERFPSGLKEDINGLPTGWAAEVYPYVINTAVYKCPDDSTTDFGDVAQPPVSYFLNESLVPSFGNALSLGTLNAPATTVMFGEDKDVNCVLTSMNKPGGYLDAVGNGLTTQNAGGQTVGVSSGLLATGQLGGPGNQGPTNAGRHAAGGANYAFVDGHVKFLLPQNVSPGPSASDPSSPASMTNAAGTSNLIGYSATFSAI